MEYILQNDKIRIKINSLGAELTEIFNKKNNLSYLWDANPLHWKRTSPVLFPNVGKYYGGKYTYNGKEYSQGQHGFARDMEFKLLKQIDNYIAFVLNSDEKTYINYPFHFSLILSYELKENEIVVGWNVINKDNKQMYFSIGGHPAFNVPLLDENRSDCYLYFKNCQKIINTKISKQGYSMNETIEYQLENGYLPIKDDLFDNDALVIENQNINEVSILDKNKNAFITVKMDCPLFGIWSPSRTAPFVCIEPWYGCCDVEGFTGNLEDKKYQNKLNVNEEFKAQYSICVF
jgi:galactose mutarotase-like enzyme